MPTTKKHNNRRAEGANHWVKQQGSNCTNQSCWKTTSHSRASCFIRSRMTSRPYRLKKTSSVQSKRRDLHHTTSWDKRKNLAFIEFYYFFLLNGVEGSSSLDWRVHAHFWQIPSIKISFKKNMFLVMFLWLLHVETKFFTNVKPSSKMQTVVSYAVFTYRF